MRILVIEDEISLNKTIIDNLNEFGYQTDSSENFKDGEYFIGIRHYDLVLANWTLPDGDGAELVNTIKHKSPRTSVMIMSSKTDKETEIKALKAGADDFVKKPLDFDILLARIEARLRLGGTNVIKIEDKATRKAIASKFSISTSSIEQSAFILMLLAPFTNNSLFNEAITTSKSGFNSFARFKTSAIPINSASSKP